MGERIKPCCNRLTTSQPPSLQDQLLWSGGREGRGRAPGSYSLQWHQDHLLLDRLPTPQPPSLQQQLLLGQYLGAHRRTGEGRGMAGGQGAPGCYIGMRVVAGHSCGLVWLQQDAALLGQHAAQQWRPQMLRQAQ